MNIDVVLDTSTAAGVEPASDRFCAQQITVCTSCSGYRTHQHVPQPEQYSERGGEATPAPNQTTFRKYQAQGHLPALKEPYGGRRGAR